MASMHANIFSSFSRGKRTREMKEISEEERERKERTLENNISRAFLSTLHHLEYATCRELLNRTVCRVLDIPGPSTKPDIMIQSIKSMVGEKPRNSSIKKLLVINAVGDWSEEERPKIETSRHGRPDGWIIYDNTAICVEAKLFSAPSHNQIEKYFEQWFGIPYDEKLVKTLKWEQIETSCRLLSKDISDKKDAFLLGQLSDFLDGEGFGKLSKHHLELAKNLTEDSDIEYNYLKMQLKKLAIYLDGVGNGLWRTARDTRYNETDLIQQDGLDTGISLNVFFEYDGLKISAYAFSSKGFEKLRERICGGFYRRLKENLKRDVKVHVSIYYHENEKVPLTNPNGKTEYSTTDKIEDVSGIDKEISDLCKKCVGTRTKNVGRRLSLSFSYGDEFWCLETYEKQVEMIKGDLKTIIDTFHEQDADMQP